MPGFVKTPKDEAKWSKAKESASKSTKVGSQGYWKLANYIFHKSEYLDMLKGFNQQSLQGSAPKPFSGLNTNNSAKMANPMKTGIPSVKMPRPKTSIGIDIGKSENHDFANTKHPSVQKLRYFLERVRSKR
jgi:hypothetical protein